MLKYRCSGSSGGKAPGSRCPDGHHLLFSAATPPGCVRLKLSAFFSDDSLLSVRAAAQTFPLRFVLPRPGGSGWRFRAAGASWAGPAPRTCLTPARCTVRPAGARPPDSLTPRAPGQESGWCGTRPRCGSLLGSPRHQGGGPQGSCLSRGAGRRSWAAVGLGRTGPPRADRSGWEGAWIVAHRVLAGPQFSATSVSVNSERLATREAPEPTSSLCAHPRARRPVRLLRGSGLRILLLVRPGRCAGGQPPRGRRRPGNARGWVERPPSGSSRIGTYCPQRCARQARRRPPVGMSPTDRHACADADGPDSHVALSGGATIHTATCHRESHADKCRAAQGGLAAEGRGLRGWAGRSPACGYRAAGSRVPLRARSISMKRKGTQTQAGECVDEEDGPCVPRVRPGCSAPLSPVSLGLGGACFEHQGWFDGGRGGDGGRCVGTREATPGCVAAAREPCRPAGSSRFRLGWPRQLNTLWSQERSPAQAGPSHPLCSEHAGSHGQQALADSELESSSTTPTPLGGQVGKLRLAHTHLAPRSKLVAEVRGGVCCNPGSRSR